MTPQPAPTARELVSRLVSSPDYRALVDIARARYTECLEVYVQHSPADECLRGRVLEARAMLELLVGV